MDKHDLRAIILKLEDRLSENDRTHLHFFLRDDTARLLNGISLFSSVYISFYSIHLEHKKRMQSSITGQSK
jgi:hypothetical protein